MSAVSPIKSIANIEKWHSTASHEVLHLTVGGGRGENLHGGVKEMRSLLGGGGGGGEDGK